jgi:hypothetical protein
LFDDVAKANSSVAQDSLETFRGTVCLDRYASSVECAIRMAIYQPSSKQQAAGVDANRGHKAEALFDRIVCKNRVVP